MGIQVSETYWRFCMRLRRSSYLIIGLWVFMTVIGVWQGAIADEAAAAADAASKAPATVLRDYETPLMMRIVPVFGYALLIGVAFALSRHKRSVSWRLVGWGVGLQFFFALIIIATPVGKAFFSAVNDLVLKLLGFTEEGTKFLVRSFATGEWDPALNNFIFGVLPTIIFFSALMSVLYHIGIMQLVVRFMAFVMQRTMGTSGAESMSAAANIFVGQTEAPLVVKPYVDRMTHSELMAIMTGGFATVAGGVLAAYVGMLKGYFPEIAGHLMAASIMNAPAGLICAKVMQPEVDTPETLEVKEGERTSVGEFLAYVASFKWLGKAIREVRAEEKPHPNVIGAAAGGASDGMTLVLNVAAMLLAFIALIAMLNAAIVGVTGVTLETILGTVLGPVAFMLGVPWEDASTIGMLLGKKMVLNEFIAYFDLAQIVQGGEIKISQRAMTIATYALLGFANLSSIAIQIGGIGGIAPSRRADLARIGVRAMLAGTMAAYMSACVAAIFI